MVFFVSSCAHLAGPPDPRGDAPPPDIMAGEPLWMKIKSHPECESFLDDTREQRRELYIKRFEYFEASRKLETTGMAMQLDQYIRRLSFEIMQRAPISCRNPEFLLR